MRYAKRYLPASLNRHPRFRYWRGHGIHSPFMYGLVRNAFMRSRLRGKDTGLYIRLRDCGVARKSAAALQNLYNYCGSEVRIFPASESALTAPALLIRQQFEQSIEKKYPDREKRRNLCIVLPSATPEMILETERFTAQCGGTLVILLNRPYGKQRKTAQSILQRHPGVSIDRRDMLLFFFDGGLQKQHYRI